MAKQTINIGVAANDNTGDPLRTAFTKINDNFDEIYTVGPVSTNIEINDNTISSTNTNGNIIFDPAGTGTVKIEGPTTANGIITVNSTFSGNVIPTANGTQTLGNLSNRWGNVFISGNGIRLGNLLLKETDSKLEIYATDGITNAILSANSTTSGAVLENGNAVVSLAASGNITLFASGSATPVVVSPALLAVPALTATGNVSSGNVSGTTGTFTTVVGTLSTAAQTAITSVGTLTSLAVTGNVSTGNVSATGIAGTLSTASQTAITSVGTLTSLAVTGNVSGGNLSVSTGQVTAATYTSVGAQTHTTASNGNITLNPHGTGIITLSAPQVFFEDGSFQTSAYNEMYNIRTSDSSTISSTLTDVFGVGPSLTADHTYEFMTYMVLTNSSTGNISINISTVGTVDYLRAQFTGSAPGTAMVAFPIIATGNVDTTLNTAATYHIMLVGYCKATTTGRLNFKVSTSSGTVTVVTGSNFRFIDKLSTTVGNVA